MFPSLHFYRMALAVPFGGWGSLSKMHHPAHVRVWVRFGCPDCTAVGAPQPAHAMQGLTPTALLETS